RTWIRFQDCCISSSVIAGPVSPSTLWTDNRYWAMGILLSLGRAGPAAHPCYERRVPRSTDVYRKLWDRGIATREWVEPPELDAHPAQNPSADRLLTSSRPR